MTYLPGGLATPVETELFCHAPPRPIHTCCKRRQLVKLDAVELPMARNEFNGQGAETMPLGLNFQGIINVRALLIYRELSQLQTGASLLLVSDSATHGNASMTDRMFSAQCFVPSLQQR